MQVYASCFSANRHLKHTVLNRLSPPRHIKSNNNTGQKKNKKTLKVQVTLNRSLTEVSVTWRVRPPRQRRHQTHSKFTLVRVGRPSTWWERCFEEGTVASSSTSVPDSPLYALNLRDTSLSPPPPVWFQSHSSLWLDPVAWMPDWRGRHFTDTHASRVFINGPSQAAP